jgi:hypothetical protein
MSSDGWSSDEDEWIDSDQTPNEPLKTTRNVGIPIYTKSQREKMPETLKMLNVVEANGTNCIYRCEPANKKYPGVQIPDDLKGNEAIMFTIELDNAVQEPVRTRLPNFKGKGVSFTRRQSPNQWRERIGQEPVDDVVFINAPFQDVVYFKKKCQDKETGRDAAFELGGGFSSHTADITPQFTITATPFKHGKLLTDKAIRTKCFHVFSKRQDRHLVRSKKRRKINTESLKIQTDITEAEIALNVLKQSLVSVQHQNNIYTTLYTEIKNRAQTLPNGPSKTALLYATKLKRKCESVEM